jgi:hypothetical protein
MPAFRGSLSAGDLADLVTFVRSHFSRKTAWPNVTAHVADARAAERDGDRRPRSAVFH